MKQESKGREMISDLQLFHQQKHAPYKTFMFFALTGSAILFLSLVIMFIVWITQNEPVESFAMPKSYILSTIVLLISSYTTSLIPRFFKEDNSTGLLLSLTGTLLLSAIFLVLQVMGWKALFTSGFTIQKEAGVSFLYIISGLHFIHVAGGMVYLLFLTVKALEIWNEPVKGLMYFTNEFERFRLELFSTYWHYIDALWLFLFLTFLFTI